MGRRRLARLLHRAATAALLASCATAACRRSADGGPRTPLEAPPPPATRAAAMAPSPPPGLLEQLSREGSHFSAGTWESLLPRMTDVRAKRPADAARRDAFFADLTRLAARRSGPAVRVLVVEAFWAAEGQGIRGQYDRVGLFSVADAGGATPAKVAAPYEQLGLVRVDDPGRWQQLTRWAGPLLRADAPADMPAPIFDVQEAAIISQFDGRRWASRSWFYLLFRADTAEHTERGRPLPPETGAAVNLFQLVGRSLPEGRPAGFEGFVPVDADPPPFAHFWSPFVDRFGEFPAPGGH